MIIHSTGRAEALKHLCRAANNRRANPPARISYFLLFSFQNLLHSFKTLFWTSGTEKKGNTSNTRLYISNNEAVLKPFLSSQFHREQSFVWRDTNTVKLLSTLLCNSSHITLINSKCCSSLWPCMEPALFYKIYLNIICQIVFIYLNWITLITFSCSRKIMFYSSTSCF